MLTVEQIVGDAVYRYDDEGEPAYSIAERVLLALRRGQWATWREIMARLDIEAARGHDANAVSVAIKRAMAVGRIERRGEDRTCFEYRIVSQAFAFRRRETRERCSWCANAPRAGRAMCESCAAKHAGSNKRWWAKRAARAAKEAA